MRSSVLLKSKTNDYPTKTQKISRIRRQRGYHWEDTLVKRFNKLDNWKAFRLGSPSVALPDILSLNNDDSIIFTIEAKSGTSTSLTVPFDQIVRCMNWTENFKVWNTKRVPIDIVCKYDGTTYGLIKGKRKSIKLKDYRMPFKEKKRS